MSAGLEIRGNSLRIWIKDGTRTIKETLDWKNTPENLEKAKTLVAVIKGELKLNTFKLENHFPNSRHLTNNKMEHYIDLFESQIRIENAPSTVDVYTSNIRVHIRPYWKDKSPQSINSNTLRTWIDKLKSRLESATIKNIFILLSQIYALWRNENQIAFDPFEQININQQDASEPDPFTKKEIKQILNTHSHPIFNNLLPCIVWSGLSISEQLPLAWEDVDLDKGLIQINRTYVKSRFRVTKNRKRKRTIQLLQPVIDALKKQYAITGQLPPKIIQILQRDNYTYKPAKLRFVWINAKNRTNFEYYELRYLWFKHLKKSKVRERGINQGRHTFASQLLSSGQVPPEWIADQLGHSDTTMIYKHYGKLIAEDIPDYTSRINQYINS